MLTAPEASARAETRLQKPRQAALCGTVTIMPGQFRTAPACASHPASASGRISTGTTTPLKSRSAMIALSEAGAFT